MEIKTNFLGNKVVVVDKEREVKEKPYDFDSKHYKKATECPFCLLDERERERIIFKDKEKWNVCVVPNKFPFVEHSYVIVHRKHEDGFENDSYAREFGKAIKYIYKKAEELNRYAVIFKNNGFLAGASLKHSHEQAILFKNGEYPVKEGEEVRKYIEETLKREELKINEYSFCPPVSIRGYETWVILDNNDLGEVREWERISKVFRAIRKTLGEFDYNLVLYYSRKKEFPVFVQILPRFSPIAGLELALKMYVNPILPEKAAKRIRNNIEG